MIRREFVWGIVLTVLCITSACSDLTSNENNMVATSADEGATALADEHSEDLSNSTEQIKEYEDKGMANPVKQLLEGEPVEVTFNVNEFNSKVYGKIAYNIVIQAKADEVVVNDVIINRGNNCSVGEYDHNNKLPASLNFGRLIELAISCDANYVREVEVKTNYGNYKFGGVAR
ncbi:hypothetical protein [Acinetobacter bereziniae]|jgi:hypothetical protein|uniref:hypothetical protein n=1 Tax=Acinetobacter bereziniae TaxID=106648 RepID=UPI0021CEBB4E|nr:hypothetical protein [Acinetobacter bereziniae]MCU4598485.1 hypothetical protein [Acinetobacter bereziniae]